MISTKWMSFIMTVILLIVVALIAWYIFSLQSVTTMTWVGQTPTPAPLTSKYYTLTPQSVLIGGPLVTTVAQAHDLGNLLIPHDIQMDQFRFMIKTQANPSNPTNVPVQVKYWLTVQEPCCGDLCQIELGRSTIVFHNNATEHVLCKTICRSVSVCAGSVVSLVVEFTSTAGISLSSEGPILLSLQAANVSQVE